MRIVAAYALLVLAGKDSPSAKDITKILKEAGTEAADEDIEKFLGDMGDKNPFEVIAEGREKMKSVPAGGAVVVGGGNTGGNAGGEAPAEEKKKEESEEAGDVGGLFGDDEDDY